jgi:protein TonB
MYEVVSRRARRLTQVAGLSVSVLATVLAGYLLMNGLGGFVEAFTPEKMTLTTVAKAPESEPPPPPRFEDTFKTDTVSSNTPPVPDEKFFYDEDPPIPATDGEVSRGGNPQAVVAPPKPVRIAPKLRTEEKPPYPAIELRAGNEGMTALELCVDARGRVTTASLMHSSGHPRLDDAALKWVKAARFTPGTLNGAPQAVCGHTVIYEWRLEDAR